MVYELNVNKRMSDQIKVEKSEQKRFVRQQCVCAWSVANSEEVKVEKVWWNEDGIIVLQWDMK